MKYFNDNFESYKRDLSKLLKIFGLETMSKDSKVIDRIFRLLTEGKSVNKIEGILSRTVIVKYGRDIEKEKVQEVYSEILKWWETDGL